MKTRVGRLIVQGDGKIDSVQVCRCHTHKKAADGQILYKRGNWKLTNRNLHLTGCPKLKQYAAEGHLILSA
jgi:hypothetical protein